MGMTFVEWLRENHDYFGDDSVESMQSAFSAQEADTLWNKYENSGECEDD